MSDILFKLMAAASHTSAGSGVDPGLSESLDTVSGTNDAWSTRTVDLSAYAGETIRLVFYYTNGANGFTGDLQLDDISVDGNSYSFENTGHSWETTTTNTSVYTSASWTTLATGTTAGRWNVDQGGTPSNGTGRTDADAGSWYVYAETSSPANVNGYGFWLRSPELTLSGSPGNLSYAEARNGADIGTLNVYVDVIDGGGGGGGGSDVTPNAVNWTNIDTGATIGFTNDVTITGIDTTITLGIAGTEEQDGADVYVEINNDGGTLLFTTPGSSTFTVSNGDVVSFQVQTFGSGFTSEGTATITNQSDSNATLDTFSYLVND
jgi:hypothetical protein